MAVVGLGYVGLPVALAVARAIPDSLGFDIDDRKIEELAGGSDRTGEVPGSALGATTLRFTSSADDLAEATFFIVAVPTPLDSNRQPDLGALASACRTIGRVMQPGSVVVFESTVYPGVTEEFCGPILAEESGLEQGKDFKLGYSPERINPGDKEHTLERIIKVVSAEDDETLERVASVYASIIPAGVYRAPSIKVAEAAKVIENTQRDLNIALVNELAIIFDRMGIRTSEVLAAAGTKWNFLPFTPGLVGGHCIGVDPYYLTAKAEQLGYHPQVILSGRRINDGMGAFIVQKAIKLLATSDTPLHKARVGILGLTFKENVPDLRNSRVPNILEELSDYGIDAIVHDPVVSSEDAEREYGIPLAPFEDFTDLDVLILAVPHERLMEMGLEELLSPLRKGGILIDVKSKIEPESVPEHITYWSL